VYKAIEKATGETVAIKLIDLENSSDELSDIQAEIGLLSTCKSPYVTEYRTSFVKGVKLWIVMEFLGGGSALDLVRRMQAEGDI
jgi:serine/threonine-protein kinase 24/25/MST4